MDRVTNTSWRAASGATIGGLASDGDVAYTYDAAGNVTRIGGGEKTSWSEDPLAPPS